MSRLPRVVGGLRALKDQHERGLVTSCIRSWWADQRSRCTRDSGVIVLTYRAGG